MKSELLVASLRGALDAVELLEAVTESLEAFEKQAALKASGVNAELPEEQAIARWRRGEGLPQVATRKAHAFVVADLRQRIEQLHRQASKAGGATRKQLAGIQPIKVKAGPAARKRGPL
jgi:hypothetical protein